jgi:very-short-patch-repair endonuclease
VKTPSSVFGSDLEREFFAAWLKWNHGAPLPRTQWTEIPPWLDYLEIRRKVKPRSRPWRADFTWPAHKIVVEVQGGAFGGGRHTRGVGYTTDLQKSLLLQADGWLCMGLTAGMVEDPSGFWIKQVGQAVEQRSTLLSVLATAS